MYNAKSHFIFTFFKKWLTKYVMYYFCKVTSPTLHTTQSTLGSGTPLFSKVAIKLFTSSFLHLSLMSTR